MSAMILIGFFCFPPLLWFACFVCLTGEVYREKRGADGKRLVWSKWNRVAAVIVLILQAVGIILRLQST